jgi:hypothetical protein
MRSVKFLSRLIQFGGAIVCIGVSMSASAGIFGLGAFSWKEEVLLHDGKKIIVERSQRHGGRHEITQSSPVSEHEITFALPKTNKTIKFKSEYSEDVGRVNLNLLALHILNETPYIVAEPNLILAYNKWGRPNPPYVLFTYDGQKWERIKISELPREFSTINLIVNNGNEYRIEKIINKQGFIPSDEVVKFNDSLKDAQHREIIREPLANWSGNADRLVRTGKGWLGIDWFSSLPSRDACIKKCDREKVKPEDCPCNELFNGR